MFFYDIMYYESLYQTDKWMSLSILRQNTRYLEFCTGYLQQKASIHLGKLNISSDVAWMYDGPYTL